MCTFYTKPMTNAQWFDNPRFDSENTSDAWFARRARVESANRSALPMPADRTDIVIGQTYRLDNGAVTVDRMTVRNGWVFIGGTNALGHRVSADLHQNP